jgi:glycosyltransferase involved in cell wall biosynthesis
MLMALAEELGLRNVSFIGRVPPDLMPELYEAADIYLNSSDIDNMPGSIIEAYASGLAVVTTNAGGIPYILTDEETGLMVERNDHEAMAHEAIRLLEDEALASKIIEGAREACRQYSWGFVRDEWLKLYQELSGRESVELKAEHRLGDGAPVSEH